MLAGEVAVRLEPRETIVREGEEIGVTVIFTGGAQEAMLLLPMGADPTGIIRFRVRDIASRREWTASRRDFRSFAADSSRRLPAGGRLQLRYDTLEFRDPDKPALRAALPAGKYRIVVDYDERNAFPPENRGSRVLRSYPVDIVVMAR
jgi:hypothetical protein